jgi:hypothetical protein
MKGLFWRCQAAAASTQRQYMAAQDAKAWPNVQQVVTPHPHVYTCTI